MTAVEMPNQLADIVVQDLLLSSLTPDDMQIRTLGMAERTACGIAMETEGYVIPYFDMCGKPISFYRTRLFNDEVKYRQLKGSPNHVYFPPNFLKTLDRTGSKFVILTEGEKKAAAACKVGFPTIAFGGVDSWRNKILVVPKESEFGAYAYNKQMVGVKLPSSDLPCTVHEPIAVGFEDFANLIKNRKLTAVIIYDTDETATTIGLKPDVQRAAADLGFELRNRGIPTNKIRQCILPLIEDLGKSGLDDFLLMVEDAPTELRILVADQMQKRSAFPLHPNMEQNLNRKLQNNKLTRRDIQRLALNLITDLDCRGIRMLSKAEDQLYYFEEASARLVKVDLAAAERSTQAPFAKLLYQYYGISTSADVRLVKWLSTQYGGEEPVQEVTPYKVIARPDPAHDIVRYQISDGAYIKVTGDTKKPYEIMYNGEEDVLFEAGQVEPLDIAKLEEEFAKRLDEPLSMWWEDVLHEVRLKNHGQTATLFSLLYYLSPWFYRWRGSQLPVELVIGEAGSGKSTLCELRLNILTGQPNLRNAPSDLKDWHSSVASAGSLHVIDNVQLVDKSLKQRLSDEICRIITEPKPHIEMRKLYTNAELIRLPVNSVFAFTSITQPFQNSDLLQRAVILELDKLSKQSSQYAGEGEVDEDGNFIEPQVDLTEGASETASETGVSYDSAWKYQQIEKFGGREAWISHHLHVVHLFLNAVKTRWDPNYQAKHRLINFEQSLMLMADIFGLESSWIPGYLTKAVDETVVETDWTLEGLSAFATSVRGLRTTTERKTFASKLGASVVLSYNNKFTAKDISVWASQHESYMECTNLVNPRKLGRYIQTHKAMVSQVTGILEGNKTNNKTIYIIGNHASVSTDNPIQPRQGE